MSQYNAPRVMRRTCYRWHWHCTFRNSTGRDSDELDKDQKIINQRNGIIVRDGILTVN